MQLSDIPIRPSNQHKFTANERLVILAEYDLLTEPGEKSAFCRRLGIGTKTPRDWIKARSEGRLIPSDAKRMGLVVNRQERFELNRLRRENDTLKLKLAQSESVVEVLGKASELLTALAKSSDLKQQQSPEEISEPSPIPETFRRPAE